MRQVRHFNHEPNFGSRGGRTGRGGRGAAIRGVLAVVALAVGALATPAAQAAEDWLSVRRAGAGAVIQAARSNATTRPWQASWRATLPAGHALAGMTLTIARRPAKPDKRKPVRSRSKKGAGPASAAPPDAPARFDTLIRFDAPASLAGMGIVLHAGEVVARSPAVTGATAHSGLFDAWDVLAMPAIVFTAGDLQSVHAWRIEGEFGDVAMLRGEPRYEAGVGVRPVKVGVSKRHQVVVLVEDVGEHGVRLAACMAMGVDDLDGVLLAHTLRLVTQTGESIDLERVSARTDGKLPKLTFSRRDLR